MNDPKYTIKDGRLWHIAGNYAVPDEEPVMILRGKDPTVIAYVESYEHFAPDKAHLDASKKWLELAKAYQDKYPERVKVGCHNHI
jgi:hypothetical protein